MFKIIGLVSAVALLSAACSDAGGDNNAVRTVGALLPLTGALSSYGETSKAALADALTSINESAPPRIRLVTEDTKTDPKTALEKLKSLNSKGIKLVIGPYASSEVREVKDFADQNGIILLSPLSTARSLAIPGDNVLRFTPDDEQEAVALAGLAWADGMRTMIPVTRDDEGNRGLQTAMKAAFESLGGNIVTGITYGPNETEFQDEMRTLSTRLAETASSGRQVGIYLTAFAEVTKVFVAAADSAALRSARWYGSDSVALSKDLVADKAAASFAAAAGYPNPILGLSDADKSLWGPVSERLEKKLGRTPDAFALAAYDALVVGSQALAKVGKDGNASQLRQQIVTIAASHTGLTSSARLNEAGDRALGNYDFWSVCPQGSDYTWVRSATYTAAPGRSGQAMRLKGC